MTRSLVRIALAALVLSVLAAGVWYWKRDRASARPERVQLTRQRPKVAKSGRQKVGELLAGKVQPPAKKPAGEAKKQAPSGPRFNPAAIFSRMKPENRKTAEAIQSSLDNEDFESIRTHVDQALKSDDPEFREHVVDALSWFGAAALPELTAFLSDDEPDVADAAANAWQQALAEIEDEKLKASTAQAAMTMLSNPETLNMLMAEITSQGDDLVSMQAIVDIIEDGTEEAVKAAMESYEDLTGHKWRDVETAEAWLRENYEAPEPDNDEGDEERK